MSLAIKFWCHFFRISFCYIHVRLTAGQDSANIYADNCRKKRHANQITTVDVVSGTRSPTCTGMRTDISSNLDLSKMVEQSNGVLAGNELNRIGLLGANASYQGVCFTGRHIKNSVGSANGVEQTREKLQLDDHSSEYLEVTVTQPR